MKITIFLLLCNHDNCSSETYLCKTNLFQIFRICFRYLTYIIKCISDNISETILLGFLKTV